MVNQAYDAVLQNGVGRVHVVCDNTDVLTYFFWKLNITADIKMLPTDSSRNVVDINKIVASNMDLILSLLTVHALSGCNTTARYSGIAKELKKQSLNSSKRAYNYCSLGTLKVIQPILYKSTQSLLVHAMLLQQQI